jgi:aminoglycoside phosphotransferase (APT) family kinase protein
LCGDASRYVFVGDALSRQGAALWPTFRELYEKVYGHGFFDTGDFAVVKTMIDRLCGPASTAIYERMIDILSSRPKTLLHGDMRADNVFRTDPALGRSVEDSVLTFVDWQALHAGPAGMEFGQAWFSSLEPEVRRNDLGYLAEYHARAC